MCAGGGGGDVSIFLGPLIALHHSRPALTRLIAAPCSKDHFYSNCSEAEMEVIQKGHVVGWRQMRIQHLYSSTFAWLASRAVRERAACPKV